MGRNMEKKGEEKHNEKKGVRTQSVAVRFSYI